MPRISPHELEAIGGGGTVEELRAIQCVETCGGYEVERMELTVNDVAGQAGFSDYYRRKGGGTMNL